MLASVSNGRPTEPQARNLVEYWKDQMTRNVTEFKHSDIEGVIGATREKDGARYYAIVGRARRMFAEETGGYELKTLSNIGYQIMSGVEQLRHGVRHVKSGVRRIHRGNTSVSSIADDRLTDPQRLVRNHTTESIAYLASVAKAKSAEISVLAGSTKELGDAKP